MAMPAGGQFWRPPRPTVTTKKGGRQVQLSVSLKSQGAPQHLGNGHAMPSQLWFGTVAGDDEQRKRTRAVHLELLDYLLGHADWEQLSNAARHLHARHFAGFPAPTPEVVSGAEYLVLVRDCWRDQRVARTKLPAAAAEEEAAAAEEEQESMVEEEEAAPVDEEEAALGLAAEGPRAVEDAWSYMKPAKWARSALSALEGVEDEDEEAGLRMDSLQPDHLDYSPAPATSAAPAASVAQARGAAVAAVAAGLGWSTTEGGQAMAVGHPASHNLQGGGALDGVNASNIDLLMIGLCDEQSMSMAGLVEPPVGPDAATDGMATDDGSLLLASRAVRKRKQQELEERQWDAPPLCTDDVQHFGLLPTGPTGAMGSRGGASHAAHAISTGVLVVECALSSLPASALMPEEWDAWVDKEMKAGLEDHWLEVHGSPDGCCTGF